MNEPRRRKLNLGDIIRRLNDESAFADAPVAAGPPPPPSAAGPDGQVSRDAAHHQGYTRAIPPLRPESDDCAITTEQQANTQRHSRSATFSKDVVSDHHSFATIPPATPAPATDDDDEEESEFDLFRYINVLLRRRTPIIHITEAALGWSVFNHLGASKYYTARARLLFRPGGQDHLISGQAAAWQYWIDRQKGMNTHLELLKSRAVLDRVAENTGHRISSGALRGSLTIAQGESHGQKNDIIELSLNNPDPERARDILNEVCRTYIDYRREVNAQEVTRLILKLETQITTIESDLHKREDALRIFKENNRMVQLSQEANLTVSKLSGMEHSLQQTDFELLEVRERTAILRREIGQQEVDIIQSRSFDDPYPKRVAALELELTMISTEYSPEHFRVRTIQQQIDTLRSAMASEMHKRAFEQTTMVRNPVRQNLLEDYVQQTITLSILETRRNAQLQIIERLSGDLLQLPTLEKDYAHLQREAESLLQTLRILKGRYEEARIVRDSQESDLKILELAELPRRPITSAKTSDVFTGALIGLILGIAFAFILEYLDQTIKEPGDVEKLLEIPLLGYVPLIETDKALIDDPKQLAKSIAEPFRAVRANLKHIINQNGLRSIMICSAVKGEGKTTLAANMAITFALDSSKVLLIDCDLRRPQLHKLFSLPKEQGVSDYLEGNCTIHDILKPTNYRNLRVATCGTQPQHPAELIGTPRFQQLIEELKQEADIVFCDSPALLPVSDVITMAPKIDGVLMVIRTLWTPGRGARQARNQLKRIGCTIYGGIINGVSHSRGYYPYYYGYYGYYSYKYSYDYDKEPPKKLSLRETGLFVEKGLRQGIMTARLTLPRIVARSTLALRPVLRSKWVWLLVIVLATASIWERKLASRAPASGTSIKLLNENAGAPPPAAPPIVLVEPSAGIAVPETITSSPRHEDLADSLHRWALLVQSGDSAQWSSLYDQELFRYPGGGWAAWLNDTEQHVPFSPMEQQSVELSHIEMVPLQTNRHVRTTVIVTTSHHNTQASSTHEMLWHYAEGTWRIVGHKHSVTQD